ncbi:MAG: TetR family transcriptional regulator [Dysgonamonadaceae bacterium]|jgi:AcrR family transcriptional regulator|nr:TetR family transcriptional regulator [Dysgonamonadaceae bacterium]
MAKKQHTLDVKDRILNASRELFVQHGYNGTSIRDIATASDTNIAHVKYYFQSKNKLFEQIFDEAFDILVNRVFSILNSDLSFSEMLESWINAYYEILPEYPQIPIFILNELNHNSEHLIALVKKHEPEEIFVKITEKLAVEVKKGNIKEISSIDFCLNVISLAVFPFILEGIVIKVANISSADYHAVLQRHKKLVIHFITAALKP